MTTVYGDLVRYRELFGNLFRRDVQAKYRGSLLGVAWTLANPDPADGRLPARLLGPLEDAGSAQGATTRLFLLVGLSAWIFFATSVQSASRSMLDNANLIRKTRFPRQLVPLSVVATHLISFVVMLVVAARRQLRAAAARPCDRVARVATRACDRRASRAESRSRSPSLNVLFRDIEFLVSRAAAAALLPDADALSAERSADREARLGRRSDPLGQPAVAADRGAAAIRSSTAACPGSATPIYTVVARDRRRSALGALRVQPRRRPDRSRSLIRRVVDPRLVAFGLPRRQAGDLRVRLERGQQ